MARRLSANHRVFALKREDSRVLMPPRSSLIKGWCLRMHRCARPTHETFMNFNVKLYCASRSLLSMLCKRFQQTVVATKNFNPNLLRSRTPSKLSPFSGLSRSGKINFFQKSDTQPPSFRYTLKIDNRDNKEETKWRLTLSTRLEPQLNDQDIIYPEVKDIQNIFYLKWRQMIK